VESSLVSFIAWTLTITCLSSLSSDIQKEAAQGTLEHIVASRQSFLLVMLVRLIITILMIFLLNGVIFTVLMLVTRSQFILSWSVLIPITCIALSACGLGLVLGGLTLVYKQTQGLANMLQFVILPTFFISYTNLGGITKYLVSLLPCLAGMELARGVLVSSSSNFLSSYWFFAAMGNSVLWLLLGIGVFQLSLRRARRKGLLNEY
jgi:ABC-2 type transport system permease protein